MPRTRDTAEHEATKAQIKTVARAQMQANGTAGLSLRAIARELDVTAPALYRYYPSLDDLITALILDAFNAIADALEAADASVTPATDYEKRVITVGMAYRQFALDHPIDFELIYGNPIPAYEAPTEITVPAATRTNIALTRPLVEAYNAGQYRPNYTGDYALDPETVAQLEGISKLYDVPPELIAAGFDLWEMIHGAIVLEMHGHSSPVFGDLTSRYRKNILKFYRGCG